MGHRRWSRDLVRYERFHRYPELRGFPRGRAWFLLRRYEREEQSKLPWRVWKVALCLYLLALPLEIMLARRISEPRVLLWIVGVVVGSALLVGSVMWMDSRMRKRVGRRVVDELGGGRLRVCLKCGYDLRGTAGEVCSECGASVYLAVVRR